MKAIQCTKHADMGEQLPIMFTSIIRVPISFSFRIGWYHLKFIVLLKMVSCPVPVKRPKPWKTELLLQNRSKPWYNHLQCMFHTRDKVLMLKCSVFLLKQFSFEKKFYFGLIFSQIFFQFIHLLVCPYDL